MKDTLEYVAAGAFLALMGLVAWLEHDVTRKRK